MPYRLLPVLFATLVMVADAHAGRSLAHSPRTQSVSGICVLGINGPDSPAGAENVMFFDGTDNWMTAFKLNGGTCPDCAGPDIQGVIESANISLFFPAAPCTMLVRTRILRNFALESCPYPDRFSALAGCPEFYTTLYADAEDLNTVREFTIPFPNTTCAVSADTTYFVEMNFFSVSVDSVVRPQIMPFDQRFPCRSYNAYETNQFGSDVTTDGEGAMNNPKMWVDILRCETVAVTRRTWGRLKQIYR
jgi:hypothetical protein